MSSFITTIKSQDLKITIDARDNLKKRKMFQNNWRPY